MYDYLIVGAGLFGAVFAHEAKKHGKSCLVVEKRNHIAGNIYCKNVDGIHVHQYGAHIFHTSDRKIWDYINQFSEFNNYINSPVAIYKDELYNLPFNMNTFSKMWDIQTPAQAKAKIAEQIADLGITEPRTGFISGRNGCLRKADQRIHRKTVGTLLQGTAFLYHQASSASFYL